MHPRDYFNDLVKPAIEEFEAKPDSIRHAYIACLFAYHFADAAAVHRKPKDKPERDRYFSEIRNDLAKSAPSFWMVEGVANMTKHIDLDNGKVRPEIDYTHIATTRAVVTRKDDGGTYRVVDFGPSRGLVSTRDSDHVPVDIVQCVIEVRRAIEVYLDGLPS
jgi:hypothetical protein